MPCVLWAYCWTTSAWHEPQFTFAVIVAQGRSSDGLTSAWHCEQRDFWCREPASSVPSTNIERPSFALRSFCAWHFWHSWSARPTS